MRIITPSEVAKQAGNKYLGVLVAAKFARYLNEFPKDHLARPSEKLTTKAMQELVDGELNYKLLRRVTVWAGRHVVLGVSGGIASYKSCILARRLTEAGAAVDVVLTQGAAEFVGPPTFEGLTGRPVLTSLWEQGKALAHVRLGQDAGIIIVAPATAHLIARVAQGLADDLLTALILARTAPLVMAPAMNDAMYAGPET